MSTNYVLSFFKSSYSGDRAERAEVAHIPTGFRKSSYSGQAPNCVEVAELPSGTVVRDSKNSAKGHLPFSSSEWTAFLTSAHTGRS